MIKTVATFHCTLFVQHGFSAPAGLRDSRAA
jgi:hypothetical protein